MEIKKRVAIVGAGASGITAIKCCLDEGLEPVCFERTDHLGGLWHYTPEPVEGQACVTNSTITNVCKEMIGFSDFPVPKSFSNYMHHSKFLEYFHLYADCFDLKKHIKFRTDVVLVERSSDYETSGKWVIATKDFTTNCEKKETFDAVLLCPGHLADKTMSHFDGQENFKGRIIHSHDYRLTKGFENKKIIIVGVGNSAMDVISDLGRLAKQMYLVARRGCWIINRVADDGVPFDASSNTRFKAKLFSTMSPIANYLMERKVNKQFNHSLYGLRPKHRILNATVTESDDLPNKILAGSVIVKPAIKEIFPTCVEFEDGTTEDDIDVIILATGYKFSFPYLEKGIIDVEENNVSLYKNVFPPHLEHATIGVIGLVQPSGGTCPISEMQTRWAAKLIKGDLFLASSDEMWKDVRKKREAMTKRFVASPRHTISVDYIGYMDEIAELIGCKPSIWRYLMKDPKLAWKLLVDPCTPFQYRLQGPNAWPGARHAVMTVWDRFRYPLNTGPVKESPDGTFSWIYLMFTILLVIALFYWMY